MDRFTTPWPSEQAQRAAGQVPTVHSDRVTVAWGETLSAAYAVDMERIVREEVSHLHGFLTTALSAFSNPLHDTLNAAFAEYRKARFGEEKCPCGYEMKSCVDCTIGPTERREPTELPRPTWEEWYADRDRLARLERFVTALARIHEVADPGDSRVTNVRAAAREYLR